MRTLLLLALTLPVPAHATDAATVTPRLLHAPPVGHPAGRRMVVRVLTEGDWRLARVDLVVRPLGAATWQRHPFARIGPTELEAVVPEERVQPPGLEYYIDSEGTDGTRRSHFASAEAPHPVNVHGETEHTLEMARLGEWEGQRSSFRTTTTFAAFGSRLVDSESDDVLFERRPTDRFSERYWLLDATYTYRPLSRLYQFGFGFGLMRGEWPAIDGAAVRAASEPGVNYGHADLELLVSRYVALGARLVLGANAEGFVAGAGASVRAGRLAGSHGAIAYERISGVGGRLDLRLHWATVARFPMALGLEITDWPHPSGPSASILSYDLGFRATEAWTVALRAGVANRAGSLDTGFTGGLGVQYGF